MTVSTLAPLVFVRRIKEAMPVQKFAHEVWETTEREEAVIWNVSVPLPLSLPRAATLCPSSHFWSTCLWTCGPLHNNPCMSMSIQGLEAGINARGRPQDSFLGVHGAGTMLDGSHSPLSYMHGTNSLAEGWEPSGNVTSGDFSSLSMSNASGTWVMMVAGT